jgi:hypothetical protein
MKSIIQLALSFFIIISIKAQTPFKPVKLEETGDLIIPEGMRFDLLFKEGDTVITSSNKVATAKGMHDLNIYVPLEDSRRGKLYTSHEENKTSDQLGDGGGGTVYEVQEIHCKWITGKKYAIDFSSVGGTYNNCSGTITSKGTVLSTEESPPNSNALLYKTYNVVGTRDTSDVNGMKRFQNVGWVVEVDPISRKAIQKLYKLGRFSHEGIIVMPDNKTIYMADDNYPSVFFKFIAESENDFTEGQLYAFKQGKGEKGSWIKLPMEMDSLINIREVALKRGATVFVRMEWMTLVNGKIYLTETGMDDFKTDPKINFKGELANHLKEKFSKGNSTYDYPYGAILEFDPEGNTIRPLLFGGKGIKDPTKHFSNPDAITKVTLDGITYLVVNEDLVLLSKERVPSNSFAQNKLINEVWWLDLSNKKPTVDHLQRFMVIPTGAESTGGYFTPDGLTYFVNIQHPSSTNPAPFNRSCTLAITGFKVKGKK